MPLATVHDITTRLDDRRAHEAAVARGPVRHVPRAFVEALKGAWGAWGERVSPEPEKPAPPRLHAVR